MAKTRGQKTLTPSRAAFGLKQFLISAGLFITLVFCWLWASTAYDTSKDHRLLNAAAAELKLPSEFRLVSTDFKDEHCRDTCAYILLKYETRSKGADRQQILEKELSRLGYEKDSTNGYFYESKEFKGQFIRVEEPSQLNADTGPLNLEISL